MAGFGDLGLQPAVAESAAAAGYERPTALQSATIPVLRRGGNALVLGSSGAGVTAAWGLALMDRLLGEPATAEAGESGQWPRVVAIAATPERASGIAEGLAVLAQPAGLTVRAALPGWARDAAPDVLVVPAASAARSIERSTLKLGRATAIVVDAADAVLELYGADALETLLVALDRDAQRVIVAARATPAVNRLVEGHVRRAVTIPTRPVEGKAAPAVTGAFTYVVAHGPAKQEEVARLLAARGDKASAVGTRGEARAAEVRGILAQRGLSARVISLEDAPAKSVAIAWDVPPDAELMQTLEPDAIVLIQPKELPHLTSLARAAGLEARSAAERPGKGPIERFREEVRGAIETADLEAQLLVLEPLFATRSAEEVAAALSALLRARAAAAAPAAPVERTAQRAAPVGEAPATFVRLFVSVGARDNVRPGDVVGAITGEAGVTGERIGRIEIGDTFTVVEVQPEIAERVIAALNGTTLRGRSLRVDYDRKGTAAAARGRPREPRKGGRPSRGTR